MSDSRHRALRDELLHALVAGVPAHEIAAVVHRLRYGFVDATTLRHLLEQLARDLAAVAPETAPDREEVAA